MASTQSLRVRVEVSPALAAAHSDLLTKCLDRCW
jgi:hypothetical protein